MPDVSCNFKPPHICLEVLHLPEHGLLLLLLMGCIAPTNTNTQLPVKPDTYLRYGHIHTHRDTLDAISQSVTHDGVSHAMEMDVRSRWEWLSDSYQGAEWPATTLLLPCRLKKGCIVNCGGCFEEDTRSKGCTMACCSPLLNNALKPRTVGTVEYYGFEISVFCDFKLNLLLHSSSVKSQKSIAF